MLEQGLPRVRWIRFLILVLTLTASRGNFPLIERSLPSPDRQGLSRVVSRHEGVVPSRRQLESQRVEGLKARISDSGLPTSPKLALIGPASAVRLVGIRADGDPEGLAASARPKYLKLFLQAAAPSSLPPPV